jgi:hypothetical protein
MRKFVLNTAAFLIGLVLAVSLMLAGLFVIDRMRDPRPVVLDRDLYSMDPYPYTGTHIQSNFAAGDLRSGDNGFFIDFPIKSPPKKAANEFRIILIGGSAAMGVYLANNSETLSKVLERLLNEKPPIPCRFTVINLAMAASHTYQNYIMLNRWGHPLEPDLILSFSGGRNDIHVPYRTHSDLPVYASTVFGLTSATKSWEGPPWLRQLDRWFPNIFGSSHLALAIRTYLVVDQVSRREKKAYVARNYSDGSLYDDVIEPLYLHALRSIKRDFNGIPIMVAFQPVRKIAEHARWWDEWMAMYSRMRVDTPAALAGYLNDKWSFVDLQRDFTDQALMTNHILADDAHLTAEGYRRAAALLYAPLAVNFQEVVHSVLAGNADVARQSDSRRTEWTCTRMRA